jgi:hypothetical protein
MSGRREEEEEKEKRVGDSFFCSLIYAKFPITLHICKETRASKASVATFEASTKHP